MAGRLYAWNTVGSLLGALLGGYALLFWLDLDHVADRADFFLDRGEIILVDQPAAIQPLQELADIRCGHDHPGPRRTRSLGATPRLTGPLASTTQTNLPIAPAARRFPLKTATGLDGC